MHLLPKPFPSPATQEPVPFLVGNDFLEPSLGLLVPGQRSCRKTSSVPGTVQNIGKSGFIHATSPRGLCGLCGYFCVSPLCEMRDAPLSVSVCVKWARRPEGQEARPA